MNHVDPRVTIEVSEAGDRTLDEVAEQMIADYVPEGEEVEQQAIRVDGVDGVLLDDLIGQDLNRRVALIHNGRLYSLMFMPLSPEGEPLYQGVLDSFRFLDE
jgi:hypothetical protein